MIKLLLVDDDPTVRHGLRMRLELEHDMTVVAEAEDGEAALTVAARMAPDVVVLDVRMPRLDGFGAATALGKRSPGSAVVILSMYDNPAARARAVECGAAEFVGKHEPCDALVEAIRAAAA